MRTCRCGRSCTTPGISVALSNPSETCGISTWEGTAIAHWSRAASVTSLLSETHPATTSLVTMAVAAAEVAVWPCLHGPKQKQGNSWPAAHASTASGNELAPNMQKTAGAHPKHTGHWEWPRLQATCRHMDFGHLNHWPLAPWVGHTSSLFLQCFESIVQPPWVAEVHWKPP